MKSSSNKIFFTAVLIIMAGGIYLNYLKRENHSLVKQLRFLQRYSEIQEQQAILLQSCLWDQHLSTSLENISFIKQDSTEINSLTSLLPSDKLIINCGNPDRDTTFMQNIAEILNRCSNWEDLQIIAPAKAVSFIKSLLQNRDDYQIWIPEVEADCLKTPSVFTVDKQHRISHYLAIDTRTLPLSIQHLRFIQNNIRKNQPQIIDD